MVIRKDIKRVKIGVQITPTDTFWVQVNSFIQQELADGFLPFEVENHGALLSLEEQDEFAEEILSSDLDAYICMILPERILYRLLENNIPVICVEDEISIQHPLFSSVEGWFDAGKIAANYVAGALNGNGDVLCISGQIENNLDFSHQRLAGIKQVFEHHVGINLRIKQLFWDYRRVYENLIDTFNHAEQIKPDAIIGLSDTQAIAGYDAHNEFGLITNDTLVVGINGEPSALSRILSGRMHATVNIAAEEFAGKALDLALQAANGEKLPKHFYFFPQLVTDKNVAKVSISKLKTISNIPTQLVGINRKTEEQRLTQYEISSTINRKMAVLRDRKELLEQITEIIRINYAYDRVIFYVANPTATHLVPEVIAGNGICETEIDLSKPSVVREAFQKNEPIFVSDIRFSHRFPPDPHWKNMQSRVVLPVRFGLQVMGVLDLQSDSVKSHLRSELFGLQALAEQLGVAIHNSNLYDEAIQARRAAEKANQLKTRLLANVSHELRAPLNIILGYCQAALTNPTLYHTALPQDLIRDLGYVFDSGEHLIRLINDLLDVSRAEIGALDLFPETVFPKTILTDTFYTIAKSKPESIEQIWLLEVEENLPIIKADPVRFRQILINLLSNAKKFTQKGEIVLGAASEPPYLHIWIRDEGPGIAHDDFENLFVPFTTLQFPERKVEGIGLGLNITRSLILLHGGKITVESQPGFGSTFHVYLPLPSITGDSTQINHDMPKQPALLVISSNSIPNNTILEICKKQNLVYFPLRFGNELSTIIDPINPTAIAWDLIDMDQNTWNLIEQIRKHKILNKLPFLLFQQESHQTNEMAGITNIITKPINNETLYGFIHSLRPEYITGPILIVDDDPKTRNLYSELIKINLPEYSILQAKTGSEAINYLDQNPALVLLDLVMPEIDGFEVLTEIRTRENTRTIPVIVISGKILSFEDIQRLDYANVIFQSKDILNLEETLTSLSRIFAEEEFLPQPTSLLVKQTLAFLQQNYHRPITRDEIAKRIGASTSYLSRIFHHEIGITLWECLTRLRIHFSKELLVESSKSITEISSLVGYEDSAYFCKVFKKSTGSSPMAYRKSTFTN